MFAPNTPYFSQHMKLVFALKEILIRDNAKTKQNEINSELTQYVLEFQQIYGHHTKYSFAYTISSIKYNAFYKFSCFTITI